MMDIFKRRIDLTERLMAALKHLPFDQQMEIVAAWFSMTQLEQLVEFQERTGEAETVKETGR